MMPEELGGAEGVLAHCSELCGNQRTPGAGVDQLRELTTWTAASSKCSPSKRQPPTCGSTPAPCGSRPPQGLSPALRSAGSGASISSSSSSGSSKPLPDTPTEAQAPSTTSPDKGLSAIDSKAPDYNEEIDREPLVQYEDLEQATGFTQVSNAVLRCYPELSDGEKLTYIMLKSFAYVGPETFVGEETLARARNATVSTISRHLQKLIKVGLVRVRRRGQGRTNVWIITRIPREKIEQYLAEWQPDLDINQRVINRVSHNTPHNTPQTAQNPQVKTTQNPQVKTAQNPQAEEYEEEEHKHKNKQRGRRTASGASSSGKNSSGTTSHSPGQRPGTAEKRNAQRLEPVTASTEVEVGDTDELAEVICATFGCPQQRRSIATFLRDYDLPVAIRAFQSVLERLERGEQIAKPAAYFYTVLKVMQEEAREAAREAERSAQERRLLAVSWARSLMREWPLEQVEAILMDSYHQKDFVCDIIREARESFES